MRLLSLVKIEVGKYGVEITPEIRDRVPVGIVVVYSQTAAYIEEAELNTIDAQFCL